MADCMADCLVGCMADCTANCKARGRRQGEQIDGSRGVDVVGFGIDTSGPGPAQSRIINTDL